MTKIKKIVLGLMCILLITLIAVSIIQRRQLNKLSQTLDTKSPPEETALSVQAIPQIAPETDISGIAEKESPDDLIYHIEAAEEELDMVNEQLSDEQARKADLLRAQTELEKKQLEDPGYIKIVRETIMASLDSGNALLFKKLNLSLEEQETIKEILADKQIALMKYSMEAALIRINQDGTDSAQSEETRREIEKLYNDIQDEYNTKISSLLGTESFEKYQAFEEKSSERYWVTGFTESLDSDEGLTEDQQNYLIDSMYEQAQKIRSELDNEAEDKDAPSEISKEENIARIMKRRDLLNEAFVEASRDILSPSQVEQFRAYLKQQRDEAEAMIRLRVE